MAATSKTSPDNLRHPPRRFDGRRCSGRWRAVRLQHFLARHPDISLHGHDDKRERTEIRSGEPRCGVMQHGRSTDA
ncbi:unnamed protein product [Lampetra planeri]